MVDSAKGEPTIEEPTRAERATARRAAQSRATVPDLELRDEADMSACVEIHRRTGASLTAILVRACALALHEVPRANAAYSEARFELYPRVNVAVSLPTNGPDTLATILDADRRSLVGLSDELAELAARAEAGQLTQPELSGATFTLWDMASHGVACSSAVLSPPQAAAIAAGAIREVPVVRQGRVVSGSMMTLTLVCDHRILHGALAARFLRKVIGLLEQPDAL